MDVESTQRVERVLRQGFGEAWRAAVDGGASMDTEGVSVLDALARGDVSVRVEWRVEHSYPPDWEGWQCYRVVDDYDVDRMRKWVDSENEQIQAWAREKHGGESRLRYRLASRVVVTVASGWMPALTTGDAVG